MPAMFRVYGPFKIKPSGTNGRCIDKQVCVRFWNQSKKTRVLAKECGCYLFAIRAGKGFTPIYVGRTVNSFEKECFAAHKLAAHYHPALSNIQKGAPVMFLVVLKRRRGRVNHAAIKKVEYFLIQNAVAKEPNLSNVQRRKEEKWSIMGVIRGGQGNRSRAAQDFKRAMGLP